MEINDILGHLFNGKIVNKNEINSSTKKINFDLYSQLSLNAAKSQKCSDENPKKEINIHLGYELEISIINKVSNIHFNVRCNYNTKIEEIKNKISSYDPKIFIEKLFKKGRIISIRDRMTIKECKIKDGDNLYYGRMVVGGGDEFYIADDFLDPSYDYDFRGLNDGNQKFYRGGLEYKRPYGWKRYALKVNGKFENDLWLGDTVNQIMIQNGQFLIMVQNKILLIQFVKLAFVLDIIIFMGLEFIVVLILIQQQVILVILLDMMEKNIE